MADAPCPFSRPLFRRSRRQAHDALCTPPLTTDRATAGVHRSAFRGHHSPYTQVYSASAHNPARLPRRSPRGVMCSHLQPGENTWGQIHSAPNHALGCRYPANAADGFHHAQHKHGIGRPFPSASSAAVSSGHFIKGGAIVQSQREALLRAFSQRRRADGAYYQCTRAPG